MRSDLNYMAITVLNLTRIEFYRMNPGIFFDMMQIHRNSIPKKQEDV